MPMRIPHHELRPETLDALIEDFVTRDGTQTADADGPQGSIARVHRLLDQGHVVICFDEESETCTIITRKEADAGGVV